MQLAQGAIGRIIHDEKGNAIQQIEIKHAHDMRVHQRGNDLAFAVKILYIIFFYLRTQHFDRSLHVQPQMLTEIDLGKTSLPQQAHKAIVPQLLT